MKHHNTTIITGEGQQVQAQAPVIVSASRAADIPAFYASWFFNRLQKGYVRWCNPFSWRDAMFLFPTRGLSCFGRRIRLRRFLICLSYEPKELGAISNFRLTIMNMKVLSR